MSAIDRTFERSLYIGGQVTAILYGAHLVLFGTSCVLLARTKGSRFYIFYGSLLLTLWTIALSCNAIFGQFSWIDYRDVDGGPATYIGEHISDPYNTLGTVAGVAMNLLADALLLYRCYVIWATCKVLLLPAVLFVCTFSMSILMIYESAKPGANFFKGTAVDFGVPYTALTITLNIIVTGLICARLISFRNQIQNTLGQDYARTYTNIVAIVVESAAPFTILGIVYVITYARHSPTSIAFVQVWGDFCAISPQLIILRVAMGKAWSKDTREQLTSMHLTFATIDTEGKFDTVESGTMMSTIGSASSRRKIQRSSIV